MYEQHSPALPSNPDPVPDRRVALFPLGAVVATPSAIAMLRQHGINPITLLQRHVNGDWDELCA